MSGSVLRCTDLFKTPHYLFAMPAIQRPYDWEEGDARLLLEDLLAALGDETDVRCAALGRMPQKLLVVLQA